METRSQRKRKLDTAFTEFDETSYNIFDWFPILTCQNIFKHLDGKDVIQASAVNKEWYKLAAEEAQMKKLRLVMKSPVGEEDLSEVREAVKTLKKSKRKFQNIEFQNISSKTAVCILPFLVERAGAWKSVKIQHCQIDQEIWLEMLRIIEPSVEKLQFFIFDFLSESQSELSGYSQLTFPRLRKLEHFLFNSISARHFFRCTSLVKLHWFAWDFNQTEDLRTILRNNCKLEDLDLLNGDVLIERFAEFSFKLKKLNIACFINVPENLYFCLAPQAQTLKFLGIHAELNQTCLELILNCMPELTSLKVYFWNFKNAIVSWNGAFPVNTTITSLLLGIINIQDLIPFETFMRAFTRLKHFKCNEINDGVLSILAKSAPALESIEAKCFSVTRYPEGNIFPNLKKIKVEAFREGAQEPSGESNFAALVTEEMRANPSRYVALD